MTPKILLLDKNSVASQHIAAGIFDHTGIEVVIAETPHDAVAYADEHPLHAVVLELALPGHSGLEFLYEFRTYSDWSAIPCIVYTSQKLDQSVLQSRDWALCAISEYVYKPKASLETLIAALECSLPQ